MKNLEILYLHKAAFLGGVLRLALLILFFYILGNEIFFYIFSVIAIAIWLFIPYYYAFSIFISSNLIEMKYVFRNKVKQYNLNDIYRVECYSRGLNRTFSHRPRFKFFFKISGSLAESDNKIEVIEFLEYKKSDLQLFEQYLKSKDIETRFVYYSIFSEDEILPEDVGY